MMQEELARTEAEREARKTNQGMPYRFRVKAGETQQIVIVDEAPTFFRHEHNLQDSRSGKWSIYVPCIDRNANCPACSSTERDSYFAMYLTIIDLNPYVNSHGEEIEFSKKLLVVKSTQQKKIMRYYERHGTLRGMILDMTRDGEKSASIGDPEFVEFMPEEELQDYVTSYVDQSNVEHVVYCDEPYDYEALFPPMDEDQLRAIVGGGGGHSTGSRAADDRALGRTRRSAARADDDDGSAGDGWDDAQPRRVASRRAPAAQQDDGDVADDMQDAAPPPRRGVRPAAAPARQAAAPARAARPAPRRAATIDPEDLPDAGTDIDQGPPFDADEPADPPQRVARQAPARRAAPEPAAAAPRSAIAARRAQIRR